MFPSAVHRKPEKIKKVGNMFIISPDQHQSVTVMHWTFKLRNLYSFV